MDEPSTSNPERQPQKGWKQKKTKKERRENRRLAKEALKQKWKKWKDPEPGTFAMPPPRERSLPVRESAKINFSPYMVGKGYYSHEIQTVGDLCREVVTVLDDICPLPLRLAPFDYPKQYLLEDKHIPLVRKYLMSRASGTSPCVQEVVLVDGYALVLCVDEATVEFVRGLLPQMAADDMGLKEISKADINLFNNTRGERCSFDILVKYSKHGFKRKQQVILAREAAEREAAEAAASSDPNNIPSFDPNVPPPFDPSVPPPSFSNLRPE